MKKTVTVNVGGMVFHIEEDAYTLLDEYLQGLRSHYQTEPGSEEIVKDIENRISELLMEKTSNIKQVIVTDDLEEVISRIGQPEEFESDVEESPNESAPTTSTAKEQPNTQKIRRKFFRDPDNQMIGGLAGGLGALLGIDPLFIRLILLLLLFASFSTIAFIYILFWILVPEAKTASDKLRMRGEPITLENIGKTVTNGFERMSNGANNYVKSPETRSSWLKFGDGVTQFAAFLAKALLLVISIVLTPIILSIGLAVLIALVASIGYMIGGNSLLFDWMPYINWSDLFSYPILTIAFNVGLLLSIGLPLLGLTYTLFQMTLKWKPMGKSTKYGLVILWIIAATTMLVCLVLSNWDINQLYFWSYL